MKIHIVQQGDSMWDLSQKYGVDFDELLKANQHIPNPDQIMPGMKVKIPSGAIKPKKEAPKHEVPKKKEEIKEQVKEEIEDIVQLPEVTAPDKKEKKALPKKEFPKKELFKKDTPKKLDLPKIDGTKVDEGKVKQLLKEIAPEALKALLDEVKPSFLKDISVEFEAFKEKETIKQAPVDKWKPYEHMAPQVISPAPLAPPPTPVAPPAPVAPYEYKPDKKPMPAPKKHEPVQPYVAPYTHAPYTPTPCHPCAPQYPGYQPMYAQGYAQPGVMQPYHHQAAPSPGMQHVVSPYSTGQPSYGQPGVSPYGTQPLYAQQPNSSYGYPTTSFDQLYSTPVRDDANQRGENEE